MDLHELQTHFKEWRSLGAAFRDNVRNPDDTIVEVVDEIAKLFEEFKHNNALHGRSLTESDYRSIIKSGLGDTGNKHSSHPRYKITCQLIATLFLPCFVRCQEPVTADLMGNTVETLKDHFGKETVQEFLIERGFRAKPAHAPAVPAVEVSRNVYVYGRVNDTTTDES
jgi:hypothetical protein